MSLNNVCFENIKDNFWYGQFGEFKLVIDKNTGCFNATKLCQLGDKQYSNWFQNKRTKELIEEVNSLCSWNSRSINYEIKPGNKSKINQQISGTYVCKELILDLASWISPGFYLKCNNIILNHFEKEYQDTIKKKDDKIDELFKQLSEDRIKYEEDRKKLFKKIDNQSKELSEIKSQNEELLNGNEEISFQLEEIKEELQETNDSLNRVLPDRNVDPNNNEFIHNFVLYKSNSDNKKYSFIKGQNRHINKTYEKMKELYTIILDKTKCPNPIDLHTRLRDEIRDINSRAINIREFKTTSEYLDSDDKRSTLSDYKKRNKLMEYKYNNITLLNYSEENFMNLIRRLDAEKYDV